MSGELILLFGALCVIFPFIGIFVFRSRPVLVTMAFWGTVACYGMGWILGAQMNIGAAWSGGSSPPSHLVAAITAILAYIILIMIAMKRSAPSPKP